MAQARQKAAQHDTLEWRMQNIQLKTLEWKQTFESIQQARLEFDALLELSGFSFSDSEKVQDRLRGYDAFLGTFWEATRLAEKEIKAHSVRLPFLTLTLKDGNVTD